MSVHRRHLGGVRRPQAGLARQDRGHIRSQGIAALGPILGRGRDADVYALDEHTVVRRYRRRNVPDEEVKVMRHVHAQGFPTPAVIGVRGPDLILERVDAPTMRADLERDSSRLREHAATLAELHQRLHRISAPGWLRRIAPGDTVLHLDLHPENVLMAAHGPQVIDWANASAGHWADDVAQTVVIVGGALFPEPLAAAIPVFLDAFLAPFDRGEVREHLGAAIARRAADPNLTALEHEGARRVRI